MAATTKTRRLVDESYGETACAPLAHPLRMRILEVANERAISPVQFVEQGLEPPGVVFKDRQHGLSHVSHHFRELEKAGCLYVVDEIKRRGAIEHIFVGKVTLTTDEFETLPREQRRDLSRVAFQGFIARADSSMWLDIFDRRTNRHLTWMPLDIDEQAWIEVTDALDLCFGTIRRVNDEAAERREEGARTFPATVALFGFESPEPPPPAPDMFEPERDLP